MAVRFIVDVERDEHVLYLIITTDKKRTNADTNV